MTSMLVSHEQYYEHFAFSPLVIGTTLIKCVSHVRRCGLAGAGTLYDIYGNRVVGITDSASAWGKQ